MSDAEAIPAIEADVRDIKSVLGRLELVLARMDERMGAMNERMNTMATREDLARLEGRQRADMAQLEGGLRADMAQLEGNLRAELATKPSRASMWGMAIALVGLVVTAMGVGAAYLPLVSRALRQ